MGWQLMNNLACQLQSTAALKGLILAFHLKLFYLRGHLKSSHLDSTRNIFHMRGGSFGIIHTRSTKNMHVTPPCFPIDPCFCIRRIENNHYANFRDHPSTLLQYYTRSTLSLQGRYLHSGAVFALLDSSTRGSRKIHTK